MPAPALARGPVRVAARAPRAVTPPVRVEDHLAWARGIARGVAADYHFRRDSAELCDLESVADLVVCEYAIKFDPLLAKANARQLGRPYDASGAFRGYADMEVRSRCRREAVRLRNGGTFHTARLEHSRAVKVSPLVRPRCGNCADLAAPEVEEQEEAWSVCVTTLDE